MYDIPIDLTQNCNYLQELTYSSTLKEPLDTSINYGLNTIGLYAEETLKSMFGITFIYKHAELPYQILIN